VARSALVPRGGACCSATEGPDVSYPRSDVDARWAKYGLVKKIALRFKEHPSVPVLISPKLAARLAEASRGHWRVPAQT
jgi:hypothetical protein